MTLLSPADRCCRSSPALARRGAAPHERCSSLGPAVRRRVTLRRHVLRHADRLRARRRRRAVHGRVHAGVVARYGDAERLRGDGHHHAAVDPAVHPEGRGDRASRTPASDLYGACTPGCTASRAGSASPTSSPARCSPPWRARARRPARRSARAGIPEMRKRGYSPRLRRRHHRGRRHARHPAAALDHDDPLRGRGRAVARAAVPRRHRAGRCCWWRCSPPMRCAASARNTRAAKAALRGAAARLADPARRTPTRMREKLRDAAAGAALRDPADRRDGRALRRLRHALGDGRPRRRAGARADRARSTASGARATSSRSSRRRCGNRPC